MSKKYKTKGLEHLIKSTQYSIDGLKTAIHETAIRHLLLLHTILITVSFIIKISLEARLLLILASFISLITELLNTAIEAAVDHTSLKRHPLAKQAKDLGSAAQMVALIMVALLWVAILW